MSQGASRFIAALSRPVETERHIVGGRVVFLVVLLLFGVLDLAIVARSMALVTIAELAAGIFVFTLAVAGLAVSIWEMEQVGRRRPR